mgnify:CR=1 FL=1
MTFQAVNELMQRYGLAARREVWPSPERIANAPFGFYRTTDNGQSWLAFKVPDLDLRASDWESVEKEPHENPTPA